MPDKKKKGGHYLSARTTKKTSQLVWIFISCSIVFTGFIVYFSLVKTSLTFTRAQYPIQASFVVTIADAPTNEEIAGTLETKTVEYTATKKLTGNTTEVTGFSEGIIRVENTYSQNQPLQATTRFLTPDGVLFRSTERVDVPAGGFANVHVVADEKGASGDIPVDTRLTIPGLWQGLQDQIYGICVEAFSGGTKLVSVVTPNELDEVKKMAENGVIALAQKELGETKAGYEIFIIQSETLSTQASASVGNEAEDIYFTTRARFVKVAIPSESFYSLLYDKLNLVLTEDEELTSIPIDSLETSIDRVATSEGRITLRFSANAKTQLKKSASIFSPVSLIAKTNAQLQELIANEKGISSLNVTIQPFWSHKTPSNASRMSITIH